MSKLLSIFKDALAFILNAVTLGKAFKSANEDNEKTPVETIRIKPDWRDKPKN